MTVPDDLTGDEQRGQEHLLPFEILYDRYHTRVYRYLRAHLENDEDAADVTQQVFFQVWKQAHTYQPGRGSFATWLFSIAHHRLVDFHRTSRQSVPWESMPERTTMDRNPEELLPDLLEPTLLVFVAALLQAYATPLPTTRLTDIRQTLLEQSGTVSL